MSVIYVADAPALIELNSSVRPERLTSLLDDLTRRVDKEALAITRSVVEDLKVRARDERVTNWLQGLNLSLRKYTPPLTAKMWVIRKIQLELGFEEGAESVDESEPSVLEVAAFARYCQSEKMSFVVVTEDFTASPLRPSMQQLAETYSWRTMDLRGYLRCIGQDDCLT